MNPNRSFNGSRAAIGSSSGGMEKWRSAHTYVYERIRGHVELSTKEQEPHTSSRCVIESVSGTHDFVVSNFSLISSLPAHEYVSSGVFTVGGYEWMLNFLPGGDWSAGHAAACLRICGGATGVTARFTIGFLNRDGEALPPSEARTYTFRDPPPFDASGFSDLRHTSELASPWYLNDDCLTIRRVVTVISCRTEGTRTGPATVVPRPDMHLHLERMLADAKGTDVTFDVGGRCLLAARSPVFDVELFGAMREKGMERITIHDMEPEIFELLLHFIYTDALPDGGEDCGPAVTQHLLVAADRYGLERLKQMCDVKLRATVNSETVASTMALAEQHHCPLLRDACMAVMSSSGLP